MNEPKAKFLITLVDGRLHEVQVDAPIRLIAAVTEQAVEAARRLVPDRAPGRRPDPEPRVHDLVAEALSK
jgi:hypothetical protein